MIAARMGRSRLLGLDGTRSDCSLRGICRDGPPPGRGRRQFTEVAPLQEALRTLLTQYDVEGLLAVHLTRQTQQRAVRVYGDRSRVSSKIVNRE